MSEPPVCTSDPWIDAYLTFRQAWLDGATETELTDLARECRRGLLPTELLSRTWRTGCLPNHRINQRCHGDKGGDRDADESDHPPHRRSRPRSP
jgi:hypothetical protein